MPSKNEGENSKLGWACPFARDGACVLSAAFKRDGRFTFAWAATELGEASQVEFVGVQGMRPHL